MDHSERYHALIRQYLEHVWRTDPVGASRQGVHTYGGELGSFTRERVLEEARSSVRFLRQFEALDGDALEGDDWADYPFVLKTLQLSARYPTMDRSGPASGPFIGSPQAQPQFFLDKINDGLFSLIMDDHLSPRHRLELLIRRLEGVESFLDEARRTLNPKDTPDVFVEQARLALRGTLDMLRTGVLPMGPSDGTLGVQLGKALIKAGGALVRFDRFLKSFGAKACGTFSIGPEKFDYVLQAYHGLDLDHHALLDFGHDEVAYYQGQMAQVAQSMGHGYDWEAAVDAVKVDHPDAPDLRRAYQREIDRTLSFFRDEGLVSVPAEASATTKWTPRFMWRTAHLGQPWHPPMFGPATRVRLFVTPVDPNADPDEQEAHLKDNSFAWIRCIVPHEIAPGHYMQYLVIKQQQTDFRKVFGSRFTSEGWAMYWEEYLREIGYLDTPALHLMQLRNALWRAVRIVVDVGLHTREFDPEEAAEYLVETARLEPRLARAQVQNYLADPTGPSGYLGGKRMVKALKRELRRVRRPYRERHFHDDFLALGTLPVPLIRRALLR